jgi:hypothetical protein
MPKKPVVDSSHHPKRPLGLDGASYKNYRNWSYKKWAWEFLRRNHKYQVDCLKVENGTQDEKQQVANDYGLTEFKKYTHAFKGKKSRAPNFFIGVPSISKNKTDKEISKKRIEITKNQIVVRFDLQYFDMYKWSINTQLERVMGLFNKEQLSQRAPYAIKPDKFIYYLRLLDCTSNTTDKPTQLKCYLNLNNITDTTKEDRHELQLKVKDQLERALEIAEVNYLYYGALEGKPNSKD